MLANLTLGPSRTQAALPSGRVALQHTMVAATTCCTIRVTTAGIVAPGNASLALSVSSQKSGSSETSRAATTIRWNSGTGRSERLSIATATPSPAPAPTTVRNTVGPTTTSAATAPDPEVPAKAQRRRFTAEYRLRILKQADACKRPGELGALLRREGLCSSHLANWRRQREQGALRDLRGRRRGPTPRPIDPRVKQLEAENRRLQRKLQRAETIIALQKKVAEILEIPLKPLDTDETD